LSFPQYSEFLRWFQEGFFL
ncbi:hypothetical protein EC900091_4339, partial [Escherichia coli 90.0091]